MQHDDGLFILPIDGQKLQEICPVDKFYEILDKTPKEALLCMGAAVQMVVFRNLFIRSCFFLCKKTEECYAFSSPLHCSSFRHC